MLLKALYDLADERKLFRDVHLQSRIVHFLIPITLSGELIGDGVIALFMPDSKGKDRLGRRFPMPRFPGENNGGKAYFLAESSGPIFGIAKETGEGLAAPSSGAHKDSNPTKAFAHFWERVSTSWEHTQLTSLKALLAFRDRYILDSDGIIKNRLPFLKVEVSDAGKNNLMIKTASGTWERLASTTLSFQVDGKLVFDGSPDDPLAEYWKETFHKEAWGDESDEEATSSTRGLCLITGEQNVPVARSHKPKILKIPNLSSGGYIVSFAKQAPAFSSYGFEMGANAPVSETAAASYALGLQSLLDSDNHSVRIGPLALCFWAKRMEEASSFFARMLNRPDPKAVAEFIKSPWAGIDRNLARSENFFSVTLTGNAGRVVVRHWMQTTVEAARENLKSWFEDLDIAPFGDRDGQAKRKKKSPEGDGGAQKETMPPLALFQLARTTVRDAKDLQSEVLSQLYRAALEGTPPSLLLLKPILNRLDADLVSDGPKALRFISRFALLRLILNRNRKEGEPMIEPKVFETDDAAYNCGRLLAIFDDLQMAAHEYKLEGAGVVERYYGSASAAPNSAFGILWRLHQHHLKKLSRQGDKGRAAAEAIKQRIAELACHFSQPKPNLPPAFPRTFGLQQQGRFALGFYQQKADADARRRAHKQSQQP